MMKHILVELNTIFPNKGNTTNRKYIISAVNANLFHAGLLWHFFFANIGYGYLVPEEDLKVDGSQKVDDPCWIWKKGTKDGLN